MNGKNVLGHPISGLFFRGMVIGIIVCIIGILMNITVMYLNDGKMPVVVKNMNKNVLEFDDHHCLADNKTKMLFLSDWIEVDLTGNKIKNSLGKKVAALLYLPVGEKFITSPGDMAIRAGILVSTFNMLLLLLFIFLII